MTFPGHHGTGRTATTPLQPSLDATKEGPVIALCAYAFEELVQWRYGAAGMLAAALVTIGHKLDSTACTAIGLTALALLLAQ